MYEQEDDPALFVMPVTHCNILYGNTLAGFFAVIVLSCKTRQLQIPYKLIVNFYHLLAIFARSGHFVHIYAVDEFPKQRC